MTGPIILRCDGGGKYGVGHVMRQLALADELRSRDLEVRLWGSITGADWLISMLATRGLSIEAIGTAIGTTEPVTTRAPEQLRDQALAVGAAAIVLDGYHLATDTGATLRAAGIPVLAMVDYSFGTGQDADLYVDQNLGAQPHHPHSLAGIEYALFRDDVLTLRHFDQTHSDSSGVDPSRVLAVFGGTDPYAAAPVVVPALLATGQPMTITAVAARPDIASALRALPLGDGQVLDVVPSTPGLAVLAAESDLVVSASGSSVWEFLCLGVPTALVCVVDNQQAGYDETVRRQVVAGLGDLNSFDVAAASRTLADLLASPQQRTGLAIRGQALVDGRGRARVVDALLRLIGPSAGS